MGATNHDVELAYSWSDYVFAMKNGEIAKEGIPYEIFSDNKLIEECCLQKPLVLEVFEALNESNKICSNNSISKNKEELLKILRE